MSKSQLHRPHSPALHNPLVPMMGSRARGTYGGADRMDLVPNLRQKDLAVNAHGHLLQEQGTLEAAMLLELHGRNQIRSR